MALDLAIADDSNNLAFDPDSSGDSFRNRLALSSASKPVDKNNFPIQAGLVKGNSPEVKRRLSRPTISDFKSTLTFEQKESEARDRPKTRDLTAAEKRKGHAAHTRSRSTSEFASPQRQPLPQRSAPEIRYLTGAAFGPDVKVARPAPLELLKPLPSDRFAKPNIALPDLAPPLISPRSSLDDERSSRHSSHLSDALNDPAFWAELDSRWILNLSMAFRDNSEREKFFITYAEEANHWRRVTVSVDYQKKPPDSLEADLKTLSYQRDKSAHIYEAIHESLPSVQFYSTVTNLKLETSEGRLHVHVTEDLNEIIKYPPLDSISHLDLSHFHEVLESDIHFQSHLSGFVYKVSVYGRPCIKKEIPGPDMIDEFLYEVNALWNLQQSPHVIDFCAIVLDDQRTSIKGLLIAYADRGTLVDIIYDNKEPPLPWYKRDKWARQIVAGLADIHEQGYVQGDFTLSNIVIDSNDDARIIDINRRGCPVGWEPPEFQGLIRSGQRISMYIGIKSDLYQLGMVLWGLAVLDDEPERVFDELTLEGTQCGAPSYLVKWVSSCLSKNPRQRLTAKELLSQLSDAGHMATSAGYMAAVRNLGLNNPVEAMDSGVNGADGEWENVEPYAEQLAREDTERGLQVTRAGLEPTRLDHLWSVKRDSQQQRDFNPPLHHDSGLAGMEDVPNLVPPNHQDSGIDDMFLSGALGPPDYESQPVRRLNHGDPNDLASAGAQFG